MKFIDATNSKLTPQLPEVDKIFPKHGNSSFSNVLSSEISALSIVPKPSAAADKASSGAGIRSGIVNLPIASADIDKPEKPQANKQAGSIDIARIVDFVRPIPKPPVESAQAGSVKVIDGNPSVAISNRESGQIISDRYKVDSSAPQRSGPLTNGVMISFRIKIG